MRPYRAVLVGLPLALLAVFAIPIFAQDSPATPRGKNANLGANAGPENMYVPPEPGQPFTAKSVVTWTSADGSASHFAFLSMLARDSSGRLYFENRRGVMKSGDIQPRRSFFIIDLKEQTRTTCYVSTKTCRIDAFQRTVYAQSGDAENVAPASTIASESLGTMSIDGLTIEGKREATTLEVGAYGNSSPLVITREVWHSPELDLDMIITKSDPRTGTFTRKIEILSREEPDPEYFTISEDYKLLDNRPSAKK